MSIDVSELVNISIPMFVVKENDVFETNVIKVNVDNVCIFVHFKKAEMHKTLNFVPNVMNVILRINVLDNNFIGIVQEKIVDNFVVVVVALEVLLQAVVLNLDVLVFHIGKLNFKIIMAENVKVVVI